MESFWSEPLERVMAEVGGRAEGLTSAEAAARAGRGARPAPESPLLGQLKLLLGQFRSPITLILLFAASLSFFVHDAADGLIVMAIVVVSGLLGYWQERGATAAVQRLLASVQVTARVLRDGAPAELPVERVVPGDVVLLAAGDVIPADCRLLEARDLHADEAALTGETFPAEKEPGDLPSGTPLAQRTNALFLGTHVVSGTGRALAVAVGEATEFGQVSARLRLRPPETDFERGVRRLGYLLLEVTLLLVTAIFAVNVYFHRPVLDSFLFSLALAVGLTPQLLPAVVTVNLAHGARRMAERRVIVKRLASIENFGSMEFLCSDKTGTLTRGEVTLASALGPDGAESPEVLWHAAANAALESGFRNPLDAALRAAPGVDLAGLEKLDEVPYDFVRKRLTVLARRGGETFLVTKGAFSSVLAVCDPPDADGGLEELYRRFSAQGFRVLGVARRDLPGRERAGREDEEGMRFLGFLLFEDPVKPGAEQAVRRLRESGVGLKVITGDNRLVAAHVCRQVGISEPVVVPAEELARTSDEALRHIVRTADAFAEVEPNQKERILLALKKAGHCVGFLGDGINDASALHAADVGISVDSAVDVAKEAADIVLLDKDLGVLLDGVLVGRTTFANTLKYVFMATSANFGNMFSVAGASLFLPFLPLLPKQILLLNFLTDLPEMAIAADRVDPELLERPRRWDVAFLRRFMVVFGLLSSAFDYLTFAGLLLLLGAEPATFRTVWFVESLVSAALVSLALRTRRPIARSAPGRALAGAALAVAATGLILPYLPGAGLFGFAPVPVRFLALALAIVAFYLAATEATKRWFYRGVGA